jgi:hypothetical protein
MVLRLAALALPAKQRPELDVRAAEIELRGQRLQQLDRPHEQRPGVRP